LSVVGFAFWKVVQFLERDAAKTENPPPAPPEDEPPA
jgi:hypothetical protein